MHLWVDLTFGVSLNDDLVRGTKQMAEESLEIDSDTDELAEAMLTASRSVVRTCMQYPIDSTVG